MEWDRAAGRDRLGAPDSGSDNAKHETVIVFDWDDTVLPTSWLERLHAVTGGGQARPKMQRFMADLCSIASETLKLAETMGKVIFITNSSPGWVDQSCQHFMPQLLQQMRGYEIFAKPPSAPITFKIGAFQRECRHFRNVISVGDGDAERAASLRLQAAGERKASLGGDLALAAQIVKSVKLIEFPTCQHLIAQHEVLQAKLQEVVASDSSLDLKARFMGTGVPRPLSLEGRDRESGCSCQLVHFSTPRLPGGLRSSNSTGALPPLSRGGTVSDLDSLAMTHTGGPVAAWSAEGGGQFREPPAAPGAVADMEDSSPGARAARSLRGGHAAGQRGQVATPDASPWRSHSGHGAAGVGDGRARLFPPGAARKKPPTVISPGFGSRPVAGGAVWREQALQAAGRTF